MSRTESSFEKWFNPIKATWIHDYIKQTVHIDPEKVKPVNVSVTPWVNFRMDVICRTCGWPLYQMRIGQTFYEYDINPECPHSHLSGVISNNLQYEDRKIRERRERSQKRRAEREAKTEESHKQDLVIENAVRRILFSYGIMVRKKSRRSKKT
ncbi:MAG: hypothetical protein NTY03_01920 [Candidatus Bathyarchaeota archaeon]|nr:hypothetical protein [Candidatus Bathyarchaeota archaeon]